MEAILIAIGVTVLAVALQLWFLSHEHYLHGLFKMLASTGFVLLCIAAGGLHSPYGRIVFVALLFSWWGDLFLISLKSTIFMAGLVAFFLAHVAYGAAFVVYGACLINAAIAFALLLAPALVILRWLHPHLGTMRIAVYAYVTVITIMTALAISAATTVGGFLIPLGAILFYVSDIFVARNRFVAPGQINAYIGLPLYFTAQIVLALTPLYV